MKSRWMRYITAVLAVCMLMISVPWTVTAEVTQAAGKRAEEFAANTYIASRLQTIFDRLVYSDTPYFTTSGQYVEDIYDERCALTGVSAQHPRLKDLGLTFETTAYGSKALVFYVYAYLFGKKLTTINYYGNVTKFTETQSLGRVATADPGIVGEYDEYTEERLKAILRRGAAGDIVQARSSRGFNHSMIFLKVDDEGLWVLHSLDFEDEGNDNSRVVISQYTYGEIMEKWDRVVTLMRADEDSYEAALSKGRISHSTHTYMDENGDFCTICGVRAYPQFSFEGAGSYAARVEADIYAGYYRSSGKTGLKVEKDDFIEVVGSVKNAAGVRFYLFSEGGYLCEKDLIATSSRVPTISLTSYPKDILKKGNSFSLSGTVTASTALDYVKGSIVNSKGVTVQSKTVTTSGTGFTLGGSAIDSSLRFGVLTDGKYEFLLTARTREGRMSTQASTFEVRTVIDKPKQSTPSAPTLREKTATTVTLNAQSGCEYRVGDGSWQSSPEFTGLSVSTEYKFYCRKAETEKYEASDASAALRVTTDKYTVVAPLTPVLVSKTDRSVELAPQEGVEYSMDGGSSWQRGALFTGLNPGQTYSFVTRYVQTATTYASPVSPVLRVTTNKNASGAAPSAPTLKGKTSSTLTVNEVSGAEYSIDGGSSWQSRTTFEGLEPGTNYEIVCRYSETQSTLASSVSAPLVAKTDKAQVFAPPAPTLESKTDLSVTLKKVSGAEYRLGEGNWQTSNVFTGLFPGTEYRFCIRLIETEKTYASPASAELKVKTNKSSASSPDVPELVSVVGYRITVACDDGLEYSIDGGKNWRGDGVFEVETYGDYEIVSRVAETDYIYAGEASQPLKIRVNPLALTSNEVNVNEESSIVSGVSANTTAAQLIALFPEKEYLSLKYGDGKDVPAGAALCTGIRLCLKGGREYLLAVRGDVNRDGQIDVFDLSNVRKEILAGGALMEERFAAADVNADGVVDVFDYVLIRKGVLSGGAV